MPEEIVGIASCGCCPPAARAIEAGRTRGYHLTRAYRLT